ncbi:hypothetical protein ACEPAG_8004 [Sanghuangporus baumii]
MASDVQLKDVDHDHDKRSFDTRPSLHSPSLLSTTRTTAGSHFGTRIPSVVPFLLFTVPPFSPPIIPLLSVSLSPSSVADTRCCTELAWDCAQHGVVLFALHIFEEHEYPPGHSLSGTAAPLVKLYSGQEPKRDHSSGPDREPDSSRSQRSGRPLLAQRQSSYTKRHASFDTPREVPLPSQLASSDARDWRASFSRNNSESSVATSRPQSPCFAQKDAVHSAHLADNAPLPKAAAMRDEGSEMSGLNHQYLSMSPSDIAFTSTTDSMTYKDTSEDAGGASSSRNVSHGYRDHRNAGLWDSRLLRPELRPSPPQQNHHMSLPGPSSPYYLENKPHCEVYAPTPTRPSSAASLPLPSQMPFHVLPSSTSVYQPPLASLPSVIEQVQSNFDPHPQSDGYFDMETASLSPSDSDLLQRQTSSPLNSLPALLDCADRFGRRNPRISAAESTSTVSTDVSASSQNSSASSSIPPPTPPTVHTPPPPPTDSSSNESSESLGKRTAAPYEPFLSHAPPPADTYITVETTETEYRLIVRLPGYNRDAIMLSTRRRRILHIAADSWEAGGGHFERRISFGYDADLARVRAEFDGEHLRVLVPRKVIPITWIGAQEPETVRRTHVGVAGITSVIFIASVLFPCSVHDP